MWADRSNTIRAQSVSQTLPHPESPKEVGYIVLPPPSVFACSNDPGGSEERLLLAYGSPMALLWLSCGSPVVSTSFTPMELLEVELPDTRSFVRVDPNFNGCGVSLES